MVVSKLDWAQAKASSMETFWADENRCWPGFRFVLFFGFFVFTGLPFYEHTYLVKSFNCVCDVCDRRQLQENNLNVFLFNKAVKIIWFSPEYIQYNM